MSAPLGPYAAGIYRSGPSRTRQQRFFVTFGSLLRARLPAVWSDGERLLKGDAQCFFMTSQERVEYTSVWSSTDTAVKGLHPGGEDAVVDSSAAVPEMEQRRRGGVHGCGGRLKGTARGSPPSRLVQRTANIVAVTERDRHPAARGALCSGASEETPKQTSTRHSACSSAGCRWPRGRGKYWRCSPNGQTRREVALYSKWRAPMRSLWGGGGGGEADAVTVGGWPVVANIPCVRNAAAVVPVGGGWLDTRQGGATGRPRLVAPPSSYLTHDTPARRLSSPLPAAEVPALRKAGCTAADDASSRQTEWCATGLQSQSRQLAQSAMSRTRLKSTIQPYSKTRSIQCPACVRG